MAWDSSTHPTTLDVVNRTNSDGSVNEIIELAARVEEALPHFVWLPSNGTLQHTTTQRTAVSEPSFVDPNGFTQPSKSTTRQIQEGLGVLQDYGVVSKMLMDLNGNSAAFRSSEEMGQRQGFAHKVMGSILNGSIVTEQKGIDGLDVRFNDSTSPIYGNNVFKVGTNPNTSIWLIEMGPSSVHCLYPKNTSAGLTVTDRGLQTMQDTSSADAGLQEAYVTHFRWDMGLAVRDHNSVARAQVDYSELQKNPTSGGADLLDLMFQMAEAITLKGGRPMFICSRALRTFIGRQSTSAISSSTLDVGRLGGVPTTMFQGIPVFRSDSLTFTETTIS